MYSNQRGIASGRQACQKTNFAKLFIEFPTLISEKYNSV